ncbi:C40 family peptidase [Aequorivita antarctica]|uniref:Permuted papain-like amidase YaeF/Yiix C92 family enzyme n=1 Tax=Aequorivita antarctica TaxID=153266 RepID=A0A5C6YW02_9FLAO|nr:YiiX/YebB-like N1pC/P60 family cysteine hydrolase [Aequorivita antarctica]TXD71242.1 hypothetical protein ESU54_17525 [Aequorivita antarctica]SRX76400.1 hypothetical protein AEQU3_03400 [Aequorivita antarctica]
MKYIIDLDKLKYGDIILTRSNDRTCLKIREYAKSNYSHALVYKGNKSCLESNAFGVQSVNPQRLIFENQDDAVVMRFKSPKEVHFLESGLAKAAVKVGMSYASRHELMKSYLDILEKANEKTRQFCTRFVAQVYDDSGIKIVSNSDYCSPADIENSSSLIQIKNILKEGSDAEIELALEKETLIDSQTDSTFIFLESVRKLTSLDIQTFDDVDNFLLENPEKDGEINDLINNSDYFRLGDLEKEKNILTYDPETFLQHYGIECVKTSSEEIQNELVRAYNFKMAIEKYKKLFEKTKLEYFASHMRCYERQLELSHERYTVFETILAWIE